MRLISIGTLTLAENDAQDDLSVSARSSLVRLKNGAFDQDGGEVVLEPVPISRRLLFIGSLAEIDAQVDALKLEVMRGRSLVRVKLRDGRVRATYAKLTGLRLGARVQDYLCRQEITVTLQRDWPYFFDPAAQLFFDDGLFFDSGLSFDGGYIEHTFTVSPFTWSIYNGGSARSPYEALTIIPNAASSLTEFEISNDANANRVAYHGAVAASKRLDIQFLTKSVIYDGGDAYGNLEVSTPSNVWFALEPGGNNLKLTGTVVGTVKLYWQHVDTFL